MEQRYAAVKRLGNQAADARRRARVGRVAWCGSKFGLSALFVSMDAITTHPARRLDEPPT